MSDVTFAESAANNLYGGLWSEETTEILRTMWKEGKSFGRICVILKEKFPLRNFTRNAVIGKAHRIGLHSDKQEVAARRAQAAQAAAAALAKSRAKFNTDFYTRHKKKPTRPVAEAASVESQVAAVLALPKSTEVVVAENPDPKWRPIRHDVFTCQNVPGIQMLMLEELRVDTCRWPLGDPHDADFRFCGAVSDPEKPYCKHHRLIARAQS